MEGFQREAADVMRPNRELRIKQTEEQHRNIKRILCSFKELWVFLKRHVDVTSV